MFLVFVLGANSLHIFRTRIAHLSLAVVGTVIKTVKLLKNNKYILRLPEIECLLLNLTVLTNQLERYRLAESDVSEYVQSAAGETAFVPPKETAYLFVLYDVLFEEIIGTLLLCVCVCTIALINFGMCIYNRTKCTPSSFFVQMKRHSCMHRTVDNHEYLFCGMVKIHTYMRNGNYLLLCNNLIIRCITIKYGKNTLSLSTSFH